ncbi:hypothetical protein [Janibacter indicus]|uniref:hypothetical protein n=1 Tax=Janibacter indicus TaxID=857417 RepID=UPI003D9A3C8D
MSTIKIADALAGILPADLPVRVTAYDGSAAGPADAPIGLELRTERGLRYLLTAPGDLGMARPGSPVTSRAPASTRATSTRSST